MNKRDITEKSPHEGFIKTGLIKEPITLKEKAILNRKGNEYFNEGKYELAKKIFITTGYSDGISRVGDFYFNNKNYSEALNMYYKAPAPDKKEHLLKKVAFAVQEMLRNDIG